MAVLPVLRYPDPRLSQPCAPAPLDAATRRLAADMLETMYAAPGRGLAAPQVGALLRLFVMDATWKEGRPDPQVVVNPRILWRSPETATAPEGCLSIPGPLTAITRPTTIDLEWTALDGTLHRKRLTGFSALCAQHEYDHLDGILTLDHLSPAARAAAIAEMTE